MKNSNALCYSKIYLRNKLHIKCAKSEAEIKVAAQNIALIAESINSNKNYQISELNNGRTKEQLLAMGFKVSQIQIYFEFKPCENGTKYRWFLKKCISSNSKRIRTVRDLLDMVNNETFKEAS